MTSTIRKSKIQTPRPYLSWSQLSCFEKSPEEYKRKYIYGEQFTTEAMELGKDFATMLENDAGADNPIWETLRIMLNGSGEREYKIRAEVDGIPLYSIMDNFHPDTLVIREYKTGTTKWSKKMADDHGQITFYALMVWLTYKKLPAEIYLYHMPTCRNEDGQLEITGEIKTIKTDRQLKDILAFIPRVKRAWAGIQKMSKEEYAIIG